MPAPIQVHPVKTKVEAFNYAVRKRTTLYYMEIHPGSIVWSILIPVPWCGVLIPVPYSHPGSIVWRFSSRFHSVGENTPYYGTTILYTQH
jgi:hypothetical protein